MFGPGNFLNTDLKMKIKLMNLECYNQASTIINTLLFVSLYFRFISPLSVCVLI